MLRLVLFLLVMVGDACATAAGVRQPTISASAETAVELEVNATLRLLAPDDHAWRLTGGEDLAASSPARGAAATEWTLTGRRPGEGELTLERVSDPPSCPSPPDCPPVAPPVRIALRLRVR
jgi:hypothetical protein